MAKAAPWDNTDAHARKRGEQTGLDTPVVPVSYTHLRAHETDRKSTRLNSSHIQKSRMPSSA